MAGEIIEGALLTLEMVGVDRLRELHERFQERSLYTEAGLQKPPCFKGLKDELVEENLFVWEIVPHGRSAIGYAGIVTYSGPPYIFLHFFDQKDRNLDLAQDAILQLVHAFFQHSDWPDLWFYLPRPVDAEIQDRLVEGGFDPCVDDLPGVDQQTTAAFVMERHTYEAYYGQDEEEEVRELEF